jgi:Family of unknown function (DUF5681)
VVDLIKENSPIPECDLQIQVNRTSQGWFAKGQSGNPAGKPRGCRNHAARIAEALLDGGVEPLTQKVMEFALDGDPTAMRLCFERIWHRAAPGLCISICRRSPTPPTSRRRGASASAR